MKITELNIPKDLLKGETATFYKAFPFTEDGDDLTINENIDIFAFTPEDAVMHALMQRSEDLLKIGTDLIDRGMVIPVSVININTEDLKNTDIVDNGDPYFQNNSLSITLKGKRVEIDMKEFLLRKCDISEDGGIVRIDKLVIEEQEE